MPKNEIVFAHNQRETLQKSVETFAHLTAILVLLLTLAYPQLSVVQAAAVASAISRVYIRAGDGPIEPGDPSGVLGIFVRGTETLDVNLRRFIATVLLSPPINVLFQIQTLFIREKGWLWNHLQ